MLRSHHRGTRSRWHPLLVLVVVAALVAAGLVVREWWSGTPLLQRCSARTGPYDAGLGLDEAENAALIAAVSVRRGMPPRAATIALAAASQESGLRNLHHGHLDSLGLFQQRPSQGWGTRAQILNRYHATTRFYQALAQVPGYTAMDIAAAAQQVQRSADGAAYAPHEPVARALASALTGQSPAAFSCQLRASTLRHAGADVIRHRLHRAFGRLPAAHIGPAALGVEVGGHDLGWAVAQWAVANARDLGITRVRYAGRVWSVERSPDGWRHTAGPGTTSVRLVLARPG